MESRTIHSRPARLGRAQLRWCKTPTTPPNAFDGTFSTDRRFRKFAGSVTCARNCTWYHDRNALTRRARPACKRICKFGFAECLEAMEVKKKKGHCALSRRECSISLTPKLERNEGPSLGHDSSTCNAWFNCSVPSGCHHHRRATTAVLHFPR